MVVLRKEEADIDLIEQLLAEFRILVDVDAGGLEEVRGAAVGGRRAVAVLCDLDAGRSRDQRGNRRDIKGLGSVVSAFALFVDMAAKKAAFCTCELSPLMTSFITA